jgi:hypothetical protein
MSTMEDALRIRKQQLQNPEYLRHQVHTSAEREQLRDEMQQKRAAKTKIADDIHPVKVKDAPSTMKTTDAYENTLAHVATLYVRGVPISQIARDIGHAQEQTQAMVDDLKGRWRHSSLMDFTQRKAEELEKIDQLQRTYWDAWEDSRKNAIKLSRDDAFRSDGSKIPTRQRTEQINQFGDVRFLDGVFKCIERRIKLLGLDESTKHIVQASPGGSMQDHDLAGRMEYYASVLGFHVVSTGDSIETLASPRDHGPAQPVDTERSPSASSGLSDIIDADYRDSS